MAYSTVAAVIGVVKTNGVNPPVSDYHPLKVKPLLVGAVGAVATPPEITS